MKLKDLPVFFFDLQTTGARPEASDILEVAWSLSHSQEVNSFIAKQEEDKPVPRRILSLTGLNASDLEKARPLEDIFSQLYSEISEHSAVIHFAQFERPFLNAAFEKLQRPSFPILCTHEIAKRLFPNLPARGIKGLAGYFGHPSGEFKRGACHVEATRIIWRNLILELEKKEITTLSDLQTWLAEEVPKKRTKYEYPLPKEKRLNLPKVPGVYRYLSQWGEILYVGKATSLHDRVNSYFRGQKGRDSFKLEMLTQAYDIVVTPCSTPLESALLETDEIKKYNPRYNISLKAGERCVYFFSHDFLSMKNEQDEDHPIGPFGNSLVFDSILKLNESLRSDQKQLNPETFFEPLEASLLSEGFALFCQQHQVSPDKFKSIRSIFALGLIFVKNSVEEDDENQDDSENEVAEEIATEIPDAESSLENESSEVIELTAQDIAEKFERHFKRAGQAYLRARKLTRLMNADIEYQLKNKKFALRFRDGYSIQESPVDSPCKLVPWQGHSVNTYDRMAVLLSELDKLSSRGGSYLIKRATSSAL